MLVSSWDFNHNGFSIILNVDSFLFRRLSLMMLRSYLCFSFCAFYFIHYFADSITFCSCYIFVFFRFYLTRYIDYIELNVTGGMYIGFQKYLFESVRRNLSCFVLWSSMFCFFQISSFLRTCNCDRDTCDNRKWFSIYSNVKNIELGLQLFSASEACLSLEIKPIIQEIIMASQKRKCFFEQLVEFMICVDDH